jgi:xanthine dehydrogenase YagS FAD-binding subunit
MPPGGGREMENFTLARPSTLDEAIDAAAASGAAFIAGGTDLMQLMKDRVENPVLLVDLDGLPLDTIRTAPDGITIGALARMSDVGAHPAVLRDFPMVAQALLASASPQVRNMGTMGGNLLQRTRCLYFRDTGFACNKRAPGSGCPAIQGINRGLAVLGTSARCIATHPSDLAVALVAVDATVSVRGRGGEQRRLAVADLHRMPGEAPQFDTVLQPGELIESIFLPQSETARRSAYVKLRDRASFEFALVSAAAGLEMQGGTIRAARLAMGGVASKPWRMTAVEAALIGQPATAATLAAAAAHATDGTQPASQNAFKITLMPRVALRALQQAAT